jgi:hypothetical protein
MSMERSYEAVARKGEFLKSGVPDIEEVPIPQDVNVESYALSSIIIEEYWQDFNLFIHDNPVEQIKADQNFWETFQSAYIAKSKDFKEKILYPKLKDIFNKKELTLAEKAMVRFFHINMEKGEGLSFPSLDDLYLFGPQLYRLLEEHTTQESFLDIAISDVLIYFMSLGRPQLNLLLVMLYKGKNKVVDDVHNDFDFEKFEIVGNRLRIKKEVLEKFKEYAPHFEDALKKKGEDVRMLKCPVLYSKEGLAQGLFSYLEQEVRRQYVGNK